MEREDRGGERSGRDVWLALVLVLVAWIPFLPALDGDYLYDDFRFVRDNGEIRDPNRPWRFFLDPSTVDPSGGFEGIYRPLRTLSFAVEGLWAGELEEMGPGPRSRHAFNFSLHALAAGCLFFGLRRWLSRGPALLAAAVFSWHPVQAEAVVWISSRDNPLFLLFFLLALGLDPGWKRSAVRRCGALGAYALALLSREVAIVFPGILAAILWVEAWDGKGKGKRKEKEQEKGSGASVPRFFSLLTPYLILSVLYLGWRSWVLGEEFDQRGPWQDSYWTTTFSQVTGWGYYLLRLVAPFFPRLFAFDYQLPPTETVFDLRFLVGAFLLLAWGLGMVWSARRRRLEFVFLAWFPLLLFPVLNPILPINILVADRFLYAALIGPAVLASHFLFRLAGRWPRVGYAAMGVGLVFAAGLSFRISSYYEGARPFWQGVVAHSPENSRGLHGLGCALFDEGEVSGAIDALSRAVGVAPDYPPGHRDLGMVLAQSGRVDEARFRFEKAVEAWQAIGEVEGNRDYQILCRHLAEEFRRRGELDKASYYEGLLFEASGAASP